MPDPSRSDDRLPDGRPVVAFLCTHDAGRSQMALGWLDHLADGRAAEGEAGAARRPGGQAHRLGVLAVVDRHRAGPVDAALVGGVRVERAVPVDVVGREVEHDRGVRGDRRAPVELEARQLDGQHVVAGQDGVEQRQADVAGGHRAQPGGGQHGGQHAHRGRLAVGARHGEPGGRALRPQPPGELDLADHLHAGRRGGDQQRRVGPPAGRGDDERGALRRGVQRAHVEAVRAQRLGPLLAGVGDDHPGPAVAQDARRCGPAHPCAGDEDGHPVVRRAGHGSGPKDR